MGKYILFLFLLASCANPNKLHKMMDKLPEATADECAYRFPIKETIQTITEVDTALLHQYETEFNYMAMLIDSLLSANCDTVHIDKIKEVIKKIPCKPITKVIIKTQENTAKQQVIIDSCSKVSKDLNDKLDKQTQISNELTAKLNKVKGQRNWLIWLVIALLFWTFLKIIALLIRR
jgi:hypothetical protein